MRESLERSFLQLVRLYTFNFPVRKGKYRLYQLALSLCKHPPAEIEALSLDGRRLSVDLTNGLHDTVFFIGEYEQGVSNLMKAVIKPGDVCFDVGANFGWYTTLMHSLCNGAQNGKQAIKGEVHAFEPQPDVFKELTQNWALAGKPANVFLNNIAVGDEDKTVEFYRFSDVSNLYSSLSTMGRDNYQSYQVEMKTLDSYLNEKQIKNINFMKVDIEGAELMFLRGAKQLYRQETPPLIIMEMAQATTSGFGYSPNDLLDFLSEQADYKFFWLNDIPGTLREFKRFAPDEIGAHVLCVPRNCEPERLEKLKIIS